MKENHHLVFHFHLNLFLLIMLSIRVGFAADFPREIRDASGQLLTLTAAPQRIISQTLATDELLLYLVAKERIIAVSELARDKRYSNIAHHTDLPPAIPSNPELILTLKPDLILVANYSRAETVDLLRKSGAVVFQFKQFSQLDDIENNIRLLGGLLAVENEAEHLIIAMKQRLTLIQQKRPYYSEPLRVLIRDQSYVLGAGTMLDELLTQLGAINIAKSKGINGYQRLNEEQLLLWQPDVLIELTLTQNSELLKQQLQANPVFRHLPAIKNNRLYYLPSSQLSSVSHYIVNGFAQLAKTLYDIPITDDMIFNDK
jgi:iron complex transport system substrate-binding protein